MKKIVFVVAVALLLGFSAGSSQAEVKCLFNAVLANGEYGAINYDAWNELTTAQKAEDQNKLNALVKENKIKQFFTNAKVCVVSVPTYKEYNEIVVPGSSVNYLVDRAKLQKVE